MSRRFQRSGACPGRSRQRGVAQQVANTAVRVWAPCYQGHMLPDGPKSPGISRAMFPMVFRRRSFTDRPLFSNELQEFFDKTVATYNYLCNKHLQPNDRK
jgi:hypothetical protein